MSTDQRGEQHITDILGKVGARSEPPPGAADAVRANVHAAWQRSVEQRRARRRRYASFAIAAGMLLFLGATLLVQSPVQAPSLASLDEHVNVLEYRQGEGAWQLVSSGEAHALAAGGELRTGIESFAALTLPGGLRLRMDQNSELRLLAEDQIFLTRGAVYVDAGGAPALTVATVHGNARDIGTRFEVRLSADGWQVQVRDGQVLLDDSQQGELIADAGQRLRLTADRPAQRDVIPAFDSSWAWTHAVAPAFDIETATLADYLSWWVAESGRSVRFDQPLSEQSAETTRLHGNIAGMALDEGFQAVIASSGFRVVDRGDKEVTLAY